VRDEIGKFVKLFGVVWFSFELRALILEVCCQFAGSQK